MIEEPTQPAGIVTADLKCVPLLMARIAFPFHSCDGSHHPVPYPWIFCHFQISPFTPATESHGLWPWMNAPTFDRDVAPQGRFSCATGFARGAPLVLDVLFLLRMNDLYSIVVLPVFRSRLWRAPLDHG
jgi:hypothetical protein